MGDTIQYVPCKDCGGILLLDVDYDTAVLDYIALDNPTLIIRSFGEIQSDGTFLIDGHIFPVAYIYDIIEIKTLRK